MSFLRRILGGGPSPADAPDDPAPDAGSVPPADAGAVPAADAEAARERELLLDEARRLDDDLIQRQLRYAGLAWTPPAQGGTRRADDEDADAER
jgi:hypothetical protein